MNDEWLKEQCNRYKNGQCSTRGCLKRGGYIDPWMPGASPAVDYNIATCEAHEILTELAALREGNEQGCPKARVAFENALNEAFERRNK